jgi:uncharacterized membrane protein YhiD involved in acid resistance
MGFDGQQQLWFLACAGVSFGSVYLLAAAVFSVLILNVIFSKKQKNSKFAECMNVSYGLFCYGNVKGD